MKFKVAYGASRQAKRWRNATITWDELKERLCNPIRTSETQEEYRRMTPADRSAAKDKGGFVAGELKDGVRRASNVLSRSMLTLDVDAASPSFLESYLMLSPYNTLIYSTHSHTPEAPRLRLIIPLTRDVSPDEYNAISRFFAAEQGINQFDPCSFIPSQLMFWPTVSADGPYIFEEVEGEPLDPDIFLSHYPTWHDPTTLPFAEKETPPHEKAGKKIEDPLTKSGIVGTFCRAYTIQEAIEKFLPDIYHPSEAIPGRYDYVGGESVAGVVIYDDRFAYSHHATDPAYGSLLNAFDLVRVHLFPNEDVKQSFQAMASFAQKDKKTKSLLEAESIASAKEEFKKAANLSGTIWEPPIPFGKYVTAPFPLYALPKEIRDYVTAISESIQTPIDMAGCAALSVLATCAQGKFRIRAKPDWVEPVNLYITIIAPPSERKSAIQHALVKPVSDYENRQNQLNAAAIETSKMQKRILLRRQKTVEEQFAKGKADQEEVDNIAQQITDYEERKPLRLFADDITPEKLASVLSENNGRMALLSSEAGIFDTLAGSYSKSVNIDVMLKGYSGDQIRVDRIGRESENILNPCLTVLLMAQPTVISTVLSNPTFRGRGLTARFLYSMPRSAVGTRRYESKPVPQGTYERYERIVYNMLEDEYKAEPEEITLSSEAAEMLRHFSEDLEPKLIREYAEIADWAGKLAGNVLRIAGLLCRAGTYRGHDFLEEAQPLVVDGQTMENAILVGQYFLNHAQGIFDILPENIMYEKAMRILRMIKEKALKEFTRRTAMRYCQSFKTAEEVQPVLDFLEEMGYINSLETAPTGGKGRPPMPKYVVNPTWDIGHSVIPSVIPVP